MDPNGSGATSWVQSGLLDEVYLKQWSTELGVRDLLDRARQAAQHDLQDE